MLQDAQQCQPLSKELRKIARNQLSQDGVLLVLVGQLQSIIDAKVSLLAKTSLVNDEGVRKALELQGTIKGLETAINTVLMMAEEEFVQ